MAAAAPPCCPLSIWERRASREGRVNRGEFQTKPLPSFIVRPWTQSGDCWTVYRERTRQVKDALDRAGMTEVEAEDAAGDPGSGGAFGQRPPEVAAGA